MPRKPMSKEQRAMKQTIWLAARSGGLGYADANAAAHVSSSTVTEWLRSDETFAVANSEVKEQGQDYLRIYYERIIFEVAAGERPPIPEQQKNLIIFILTNRFRERWPGAHGQTVVSGHITEERTINMVFHMPGGLQYSPAELVEGKKAIADRDEGSHVIAGPGETINELQG